MEEIIIAIGVDESDSTICLTCWDIILKLRCVWSCVMMHIWLRVTPFGILHKENLLSSKSIAILKELYAFNSLQKTIFTYCTITLNNFQN